MATQEPHSETVTSFLLYGEDGSVTQVDIAGMSHQEALSEMLALLDNRPTWWQRLLRKFWPWG